MTKLQLANKILKSKLNTVHVNVEQVLNTLEVIEGLKYKLTRKKK